MKSIIRAGLLLGLLSTAAAVHAEETMTDASSIEMRPYLSEMYTFAFDSDDRVGVNEGRGGQLGLGFPISEHWGWEVSGFYSNYPHDQAPGSNAQREYGGMLDGLFFYSRQRAFSPYFAAGAGGVRTDVRGTSIDSTDPFAHVGLGAISYFTIWGADLGIRFDARYRHIFLDKDALGSTDASDIDEAIVKLGIVIPLGKRPVEDATADKKGACADSDGDGVCDSADLCPGTPAGTVVDAKGCPKAAPTGATKKFEDVHFAFDKSDVADSEKPKLDSAATTIDGMTKTTPALKVDVSGHTDWVGTDGYNQGLSERRANSVKSYLVRKGVSASRINTFAYGESKPVASNETAEGRAQNRRAEVQAHP